MNKQIIVPNNKQIQTPGRRRIDIQTGSTTGEVHIGFPFAIVTLSMSTQDARSLAESLLDHAARSEGKDKEVLVDEIKTEGVDDVKQ